MSDQMNIQRISSKTSIGFPEIVQNSAEKKTIVSEIKEREETMTDTSHVLIHCERHNKICLSIIGSKGLWLPSLPLGFKDSWTFIAKTIMRNIGLKTNDFDDSEGEILNIFRVQMTQSSDFLMRITFLVRIPKEPEQIKCCSDDLKFKWISIETIGRTDTKIIWGPEVNNWVRFWISEEDIHISEVEKRIEYGTAKALRHYCDQPTACTTNEQIMIRSACFAERDILRVYDLFVRHCYPSQFMTFTSFTVFVKKISLRIIDKNLKPTFRAFDCQKKSYLCFNDLLLGLAALDQATQHGGPSGQLRCGYLLRFYDSDSDGYLTQPDICRMINDIRVLKDSVHKKSYDSKASEESADHIIRTHGSENRISLEQLVTAIGNLKFRGTSGLFRAQGSIVKPVIRLCTKEKSKSLSVALVKQNRYDNCCHICRKITHKLSQFVYKMSESGRIVGFDNLNTILSKISISAKNTILPKNFAPILCDSETFDLATDLINRVHEIKRRLFDEQDIKKEEKKQLANWFYPSKQVLINNLIKLCETAKKMMENEERVLRISSPCFIFGDIHGNLKDLMIFASDFWRMSPHLSESNYLFLGDYVDRGIFGVECVIYLLSLKLISPKSFWLCRGNHEVRSLQEQFTFYNECIAGYSQELWIAINEVFDRLPFAAVIDGKLFCSHGGIPTSTNSLEVLSSQPSVLSDPQNEAPTVWEVLWNDPMTEQEFKDLTSFERKEAMNSRGFLNNTKRGTAFYYSGQAVDEFLEHNNLQYIIRGHELVPSGYRFQMNGKVITVFSTSLYCNQKNEASILYINQNKIRVIRVHTFD